MVALANFLNLSIKIKILQEWNSRSEPFEIKNRNKYQSMHNPIAPNVEFPLRHLKCRTLNSTFLYPLQIVRQKPNIKNYNEAL